MSEVGELSTTILVIFLITFVIVVWDVFLYVNKKETISQAIYKLSKITIIVPFIAGVLCGHWFW